MRAYFFHSTGLRECLGRIVKAVTCGAYVTSRCGIDALQGYRRRKSLDSKMVTCDTFQGALWDSGVPPPPARETRKVDIMWSKVPERIAVLAAAISFTAAAPASGVELLGDAGGVGLAGYNPNPARCHVVGHTDGFGYRELGFLEMEASSAIRAIRPVKAAGHACLSVRKGG